MVFRVIVSCSKAVQSTVLQDNHCRAGGIPRDCLQAAGDMSQPSKGVSKKLPVVSMPVSWEFERAQFQVNSRIALPVTLVSANSTPWGQLQDVH